MEFNAVGTIITFGTFVFIMMGGFEDRVFFEGKLLPAAFMSFIFPMFWGPYIYMRFIRKHIRSDPYKENVTDSLLAVATSLAFVGALLLTKYMVVGYVFEDEVTQ